MKLFSKSNRNKAVLIQEAEEEEAEEEEAEEAHWEAEASGTSPTKRKPPNLRWGGAESLQGQSMEILMVTMEESKSKMVVYSNVSVALYFPYFYEGHSLESKG